MMRSERERVGAADDEAGRGTPGRAERRARGGTREQGRRGPAPAEPTPAHAHDDKAAEVEGKDIVQIGSEGSFPASDPPAWMGRAVPCGPAKIKEGGQGA